MRILERAVNRLFASSNSSKPESTKKVKGKTVTLKLSDKHEPFGAIDIADIKQALEDEDFAQLQSLYFFMMRDLKIGSSVLIRKQPLLALPYKIETDNAEFAEFIKDNVNMRTLLNGLTHSIYYGVSLIDVDYTVIEQKLAPKFHHISSRYLYADKSDGKLKSTIDHLYIKQGQDKLFLNKLQPERSIFHKHAIDIGEITDFSLASKLVWFFALKHLTIAHNMQYFDALGTPPLIMKTDGDEDEAVEALYSLKSQGVGVIDKEDEIKYLLSGQASKTDFLSFIKYIDDEMKTFILGNTLSSGDGKTGSYAQSKVHENRQKEFKSFDAQLIAETITEYLNRLEIMNYANPKGVKFSFDLKEKKDLKDLSIVVKNLSDAGWEVEQDDIETQFGFRVKRASDVATQENNSRTQIMTKSLNNQQGNAPVYEDELDSQLPDTKAEEQAIVKNIYNLLAKTNSYDEAYQLLLDQYSDMDLTVLENSLFKAIGNSQILADAEVKQEEEVDV